MRAFAAILVIALFIGIPLDAQTPSASQATASPASQTKPADDLTEELIKTGLNLLASVITIGLGWFIGQRLTVQWNLYQKAREYDLATADEFHKLYGEFFAVWKLWNDFKDHTQNSGTDIRNELLTRACGAEGGVESMLVRLAISRNLKADEIAVLGKFRQGYQLLRESISTDVGIPWHASNNEQYVTFKRLATNVAAMIAAGKSSAPNAAQAFLKITSNVWEFRWWDMTNRKNPFPQAN
jgi:hypothetical protein